MNTRRMRWGDNDRYFGPFTYAYEPRYQPFAIELDSGDGDDYPGCCLRLRALGHTLIVALPPIIQPKRTWVDLSMHEWSGPNKGYWDSHSREYGFSIVEGAVHLSYGAKTMDSSTDQSKCWFIPWTQWRPVRTSLYGLDGEHVWSEAKTKKGCRWDWEAWRSAKDACPSATFAFTDFDGERITAKTLIEEREWRLGTGYFKWLSLFRKPKIARSLDINFAKETGEKKGSWKGGTTGHSIDMLPGELHEGAFRRYCLAHKMKFIGREV